MRHAIWWRKRVTVLTDPQRRVYWGVPFASEEVWTGWARFYALPTKDEAEASAASWRTINPRTHQYEVRPE